MIAASFLALAAALVAIPATAQPAPPDAPVARPTGASIPANLLRLSIAFARPPEGPVLPRLSLVRGDGSTIEEPFLDQELWSPDGRTLTVLMHPGRVKTGLAANESLGRALIPGDEASLIFDGRRIGGWTVVPPDIAPPDPSRWRTTAPRSGTREAVIVQLDEPVDALGDNLIAVRDAGGRRVGGTGQLVKGEAVWRFTPRSAWQAERYVVVAAPDLEDPAGNRPGQDFEHSPGATSSVPDGPAFQPTGGNNRP
ncbi:hypothetical protein M0208_05030 [Sphingomonas sp. SUN019]|uniref:hypothetical protein n=1 Tax=Sphingomonas sp. SUN019 TaxID=2937788 RepID=UPI002164CEAE|nr:hypothetical protein [Sphingomonas sp. SUN019]UVO49911.1 hypothetical protein M0208_05030 [Sphingomonas sp. SUN019]